MSSSDEQGCGLGQLLCGVFRHKSPEDLSQPSSDRSKKSSGAPVVSVSSAQSCNRSAPLCAADPPVKKGDVSTEEVQKVTAMEKNDAKGAASDETKLVPADSAANRASTKQSSDLWSRAYQEAVESLGEEIDAAILQGDNVAQLFRRLEDLDEEASQESAFRRGVKYLQSLQVPLERFKLALDLAKPLADIEPTAGTVVGVVRSVTALAISVSTANVEFAKQIGQMLEQISYIDECDTLGQKTNKMSIHKELVLVYQKLLEFYSVAFEILTRRGAKLVISVMLDNGRLPDIVKEFLSHAEILRNLVQNATLEIVQDIKAMLYDREISRWLGGGKLTRQSQYLAELRDIRADEACEFLLQDANFVSWLESPESEQLVILGDMGSGKTTAMSFVIDELHQRNQHQLPQPKLCYHFCKDDETGQIVHILSALILSLLEQLSGLKRTFFDWYKHALACGNFDPSTDAKKLEEFLLDTLRDLDRPLFIAVDGLDECDPSSRANLLRILRTLCRVTPRVKILLATRPQEEILDTLVDVPRIELQMNTARDRVIVERLVGVQLSYLSGDVALLVVENLSSLMHGSAIWTKMVVELIAVRRTRAIGPMRAFFKQLPQPGQLSALYANLFSRYTADDDENQRLATAALEILAIARRPLSILELAWAVALRVAPSHITTVAALAELVDHQRVVGLIQPFVARVDFDQLRKKQVRPVHQSVKEFVLGEFATMSASGQLGPNTIRATDPNQVRLRVGALEADMLELCVRYLLLDEMDQVKLFSDEQVAIEMLPQDTDLFSDGIDTTDYDPNCTWETLEESMTRYDPLERGFGELFIYAACYWNWHYGALIKERLPDLRKIEELCKVGSVHLHNWTLQNSRPECTLKERFPFDGELYDPLGVSVLYASPDMLQMLLEKSTFDRHYYFPDTAVRAAEQICQWSGASYLPVLFKSAKIGHQLWNIDFFGMAIRTWFTSKNQDESWEAVFDLVHDVWDQAVKDGWAKNLLEVAKDTDCTPVLERIAEKAKNNAELLPCLHYL